MARKQMSEAAKAARVAKMKATKEKNKKAALEQLGVAPRKKFRKTRNLTPEQKQAAIERLAKARAARNNEGPSTNSMYAEEVRNLPDDNPLSLAKVKQWIAHNKNLLSSLGKDSPERDRTAAYIANLEQYLRSGVYTDLFFGIEQQNKIKYRCVVMAYYPDGTPKRTVGVVYPDIGEYTIEMAQADNERRQAILNKGKVRKAN
jgi:hypothetical protein